MVDSLVYHKIVRNRREAVLFEHAGGPGADGTGITTKGVAAFADSAFLYRFNLVTVKKYVENYNETIATWACNLTDADIVGSIREDSEYDLEVDAFMEGVILEDQLSKIILQEEEAPAKEDTEEVDQATPLDESIHTKDLRRHESMMPQSPTKAQDETSLWSSLSTLGFLNNPNLTDKKMKQAQDFIRIARFLKRDRYYHMRKYKDVFVGSEVISQLVKEGVVKSKAEAVQLGRQMEKDLSLFRHVCGDHRFDDVFYFYRFRPRVLELLGEQDNVRDSQKKLYSSLWA
ncbi:MAG: hypothetical protein SGARI_004755 [Bacillariaceae sp.]